MIGAQTDKMQVDSKKTYVPEPMEIPPIEQASQQSTSQDSSQTPNDHSGK